MARRYIGGFVQWQRLAINMLRPLPRGQPPDGRAQRGLRLTYYQLGVLLALTEFMGREDTILRQNDGKGRPMTIRELADELGISRQNLSTTLKALETAGAVQLLGTTRDRKVAIQPYIAHRFPRPPRRDEAEDDIRGARGRTYR